MGSIGSVQWCHILGTTLSDQTERLVLCTFSAIVISGTKLLDKIGTNRSHIMHELSWIIIYVHRWLTSHTCHEIDNY